MHKIIQKLQEYWKEIFFIVAVVAVVNKAMAIDEKVKEHDSTFKEIAQISKSLKDPNKWMLDYLLNHSIDTAQARNWAYMPRGPLLDSTGKHINNIPFLNKEKLPEIGVMQMYTSDSLISLSTLWNFIKKQ